MKLFFKFEIAISIFCSLLSFLLLLAIMLFREDFYNGTYLNREVADFSFVIMFTIGIMAIIMVFIVRLIPDEPKQNENRKKSKRFSFNPIGLIILSVIVGMIFVTYWFGCSDLMQNSFENNHIPDSYFINSYYLQGFVLLAFCLSVIWLNRLLICLKLFKEIEKETEELK